MADELPMNDLEGQAPSTDLPPDVSQPEPQRDDRPRDEAGKFAPKDSPARGQPNAEAARRREAQERDDWRRRAEEAERRANDVDGKYNTLNKRFEDMSKVLAGEDPAAPVAPDPLADLNGKVDKIAERFQQSDQQRAQEEQWQRMTVIADQQAAEFRQERPDLDDAIAHYTNARVRQLQLQGRSFGDEKGQIGNILLEEATALWQLAEAQGIPFPKLAYEHALTMGYQPGPARTTATQPQHQQRPVGGRSLGTGGGPAGGGMTAQQIASMDEADYSRFRSTPEGKAAIRRAMGG